MMLSAPREVRLKRKRNEEPPSALVLADGDRASANQGGKPKKKLRYQLLSNDRSSTRTSTNDSTTVPRGKSSGEKAVQRLFHLRKTSAPQHSKRKHGAQIERHHLPVIEERSSALEKQIPGNHVQQQTEDDADVQTQVKRPGKGSAIQNRPTIVDPALRSLPEKQDDVQALADSMHEFAMKELAKESTVSAKNKPKMSAAQSKLRHQRVLERNQADQQGQTDDVEMTDFVYDTYVLAPSDEMDVDIQDDIALLIIDESDQEYWQSFIYDDHDDEHEEQDDGDEDENAEDHYATEYPEDELDQDDEFDENAYRYRNRAASDDEQYDLRDEEYDDDDDDDEDSKKHSNSMVRHFEQYLNRLGNARQRGS